MVSHKELFVESHHLVTINNTYVNWGKVKAMLIIDSSANQRALHAEPWQIRVALQPPFIQGRWTSSHASNHIRKLLYEQRFSTYSLLNASSIRNKVISPIYDRMFVHKPAVINMKTTWGRTLGPISMTRRVEENV